MAAKVKKPAEPNMVDALLSDRNAAQRAMAEIMTQQVILRRQVVELRRLADSLAMALEGFSVCAADSRSHPVGCLCAVTDKSGYTCWERHNNARAALDKYREERGTPCFATTSREQ